MDDLTALEMLGKLVPKLCAGMLAVAIFAFPAFTQRAFKRAVAARAAEITRELKQVLRPMPNTAPATPVKHPRHQRNLSRAGS